MAEETPDPITPELRDAFSDAIGQYEEWRRGESEPVVSLNRLPTYPDQRCLRARE
jgi:hypothetical protein